MTVTIVGAQLGDEGKGGIVDLLCEPADVVSRYQGGDNAGHTVVRKGEKYKLSLVPSGAIRGKIGVLGNGCVVNPATLFDEIDGLRDRGLDPDVRVAERAHVILPFHRVLDGIEEEEKSEGDLAAGTTGRGIGPTYEDKAGRRGVRIGDLLDPEVLRNRLEYLVPHKRALAEKLYDHDPGEAFDVEAVFEEYVAYGERLKREGMTVSAGDFLAGRLEAGDEVVLEGAQGTSLDIDHGIYPYVTSSNPTAGGACMGTGLAPEIVGGGEIIGIVKAYLSRVGTGPLPTELKGDAESEELADYIREEGDEYGTVTGRPRRVGWLDMPMLRTATRASGFTGLAVNHVDVLAGLDVVKVGHAYDHDGEHLETMPTTTEQWGNCEPIFEEFEGWPEVDWDDVAEEGYDAVPPNAREYLEYVSAELDTPLSVIGLGPGREQSIVLQHPFE